MSKKKNFTKEQKHLIKQCMLDADIMGLSKKETIDYVKGRLGLDNDNNNDDSSPIFSEGSYRKFRSEVLNDDSNVQWILYYARKGFVEFYRKHISEMEIIQKETIKQWSIETKKPDSQKDKNLILRLVAELRANNQQLTSLGMVTPIIATIKNIIDDKDKKIDNTSRFTHHHPIQYKANIDNSTTTETKDPFNELTKDKLTEDNNRKF